MGGWFTPHRIFSVWWGHMPKEKMACVDAQSDGIP